MPHLFEQARHEIKEIGVRGAMHLEFVAFPSSAFDLDSIMPRSRSTKWNRCLAPFASANSIGWKAIWVKVSPLRRATSSLWQRLQSTGKRAVADQC
ncbi:MULTISPECIES: hypothetical protein [Sphingobium]|jgi:hypothetical protein|uniref:hypothetical protein n=1 Tax=Sphingobium TaxID=165695 RepID=UPI0010F82D74|nr:hypothetical protein [Sphingobium sp. RSMS]UXC92970.1 hypothetical protein EGM87_21975 [Sphingobium sp. RSMS]